jgi:hypothetical protein
MGRWSTVLLGGVRHAVRVRVCAPPAVRARRVMERFGIDQAEATRRIAAYDEGVRALVINTEAVTLETGVGQVLALAAAPEFQPTEESRAALWAQTVAARARATLRATRATSRLELDVRVTDGRAHLTGVVGSEEEREAALAVVRGVRGVVGVVEDLKVFRPPVR